MGRGRAAGGSNIGGSRQLQAFLSIFPRTSGSGAVTGGQACPPPPPGQLLYLGPGSERPLWGSVGCDADSPPPSPSLTLRPHELAGETDGQAATSCALSRGTRACPEPRSHVVQFAHVASVIPITGHLFTLGNLANALFPEPPSVRLPLEHLTERHVGPGLLVDHLIQDQKSWSPPSVPPRSQI